MMTTKHVVKANNNIDRFMKGKKAIKDSPKKNY